MRQIILSVLLLIMPLSLPADGTESGVDLNRLYAPYATLLERFLEEKNLDSGGLVSAFHYDRARTTSDTRRLLDQQRTLLAEFNPEKLTGKYESIAFWLNAYNFFMIDHLLTNLQGGRLVESVWDYGGRYSPFKKHLFERDLFTVGGTSYSLSTIEKGILLGEDYQRRGWKEARVHYAVNCASVGCPPLRMQLYTGDNTDALMTENTIRSLKVPRQMFIEGSNLYLSELFKWYREDFEQEAGSIRDFIKAYTDQQLHKQIDLSDRILYINYDWSLNKPENFNEFHP